MCVSTGPASQRTVVAGSPETECQKERSRQKKSGAYPSYLESLHPSLFLSPVVQTKQMVSSKIQQSSLASGVQRKLGVNVS